MLSEVTINKFSQLVYLDLPGVLRSSGNPTVGMLADFYTADPVGRAHLQTRFGEILREYRSWRTFLAEGLDDVRDFQILYEMDDNRSSGSGFYACSYRSPGGDLVAAFRGSEMLGNRRYRNDYETDFALCYERQTPQQKKAGEYLLATGDFHRRPYYLTGHSLGGNLALYGAACAPVPGRMLGCYAFNAPGFCGEMTGANRAGIAAVRERLYPIQNRHDVVSSLLTGIAEPIIAQSAFHPDEQSEPGAADILYPHSNFLFLPQGEHFARAQEGEKDALCRAVNRLTRLFLLLPRFAKKKICDTLLDAIYTAQPPAKRLGFLLERVTNTLVRQGVEEEHLEFGAGLYWARQTAEDETAAQCYRRLSGGGLAPSEEIAETAVLLLQLLQHRCTGSDCGKGGHLLAI